MSNSNTDDHDYCLSHICLMASKLCLFNPKKGLALSREQDSARGKGQPALSPELHGSAVTSHQ